MKSFCIACLISVLSVGLSFGDDQASETTPQGEIITIPDVADNLRLLGHSLNEAIDHLEHQDVKAFLLAWENMVETYVETAEAIGQAQENLGDVEMSLALLEEGMAAIGPAPPANPEERERLAEGITSIRSQLLARLAALRQRLDEAATDEDKRQLLKQMQGLLVRIEQMDQMTASLAEGAGPVVPGFAMQRMRDDIEQMKQALKDEQESLKMTADTVRTLVRSSADQMEHTFAILDLQQQIPRDQFAALRRNQQGVQQNLNDLIQTQRKMSVHMVNLMTAGVNDEEIDETTLLESVDALIKRRK
ncbi:MAG: hypothetical protein R3C18_04595 [Planctomycetaceae bacterium]